MLICRDYTK